MAIELVTGRYGEPHVGSEDVRAYNAYATAKGRYVLHGGGATVENANTVLIKPVELLVEGAHIRITGTGEQVEIDNGNASYNRIDVIAFHYKAEGQESGDVREHVTLEVVKGTNSSVTPVEPDMPKTGDLLENVSETYIPYYSVRISGLTPQTPVCKIPTFVNPSDVDGENKNPSVLVNLASNSAATAFQAAPRPGVTGILKPTNGGTGQSSLQATRNAMGLGNTSGPLPVANGGTGQSTLASGQALIGNGTGGITTRAIQNETSIGPLDAYNTSLITSNTLAYWNGSYNSSGSSNITKLGTVDKGTWNASTIPITKGGTGQTSRVNAIKALTYLGDNITGRSSNDTREFWMAQGNGYTYINQNEMLSGQLSRYGFLINIVTGAEVHQIWLQQSSGITATRGGNALSNSLSAWRTLYDTGNLTTSDIALKAFPVGSVFITATQINPASLLGGTWRCMDTGYYIRSLGNTQPAWSAGGSNSVTVTQNNSPWYRSSNEASGLGLYSKYNGTISFENRVPVARPNNGNGTALTVTPRYMSLHIWSRTA